MVSKHWVQWAGTLLCLATFAGIIVFFFAGRRPEDVPAALPAANLPGQEGSGSFGKPTVPFGERRDGVWPSPRDGRKPEENCELPQFKDITRFSGISFCHTDGSSGSKYIVETVASGLATFDYDGDGQIDIYFLNGCPLGAESTGESPSNLFYRNLGQLRFSDITPQSAVGDTGYGLGVAVGDYNNDGFADLYLSNFGPNVLYRNNGDGTFTEVTAMSGVQAADPHKVGAGASFLDMDADGDLDLFVANYLVFSYERHVVSQWRGMTIYAGPERFLPLPSIVFRNEGDGSFVDISHQSGVAQYPGKGMGMVCGDYDDDGDTDVFVNNDGPPGNFLFRNNSQGFFEEVAALSGTAFAGSGLINGAMGVDCGDFDNDGRFDFYVTSYQGQFATLYRNLDGRLFEDVTLATGAGEGSFNQVTWGCGIVDLDNDGFRDLFFGCGHLIDNIDLLDGSTSYRARPVFLRNINGRRFQNASAACGLGALEPSVARGVAFDDLDDDGDWDIVILNSRLPAMLLRNDSPKERRWLQIQLLGTRSNRDGVGARVRVVAGNCVWVDEVRSGRGYQSHFGSRLHFGLGEQSQVDRIEVSWLGGGRDVIERIPANQILLVIEGRGWYAAWSDSARVGGTQP